MSGGAEVTRVPLSTEFRATLTLVETYLHKSEEYEADIALLEEELLEEKSLKRILETEDTVAFEAIREAFRDFLATSNDRKAKLGRLGVLHDELRSVVARNDGLLRANAAVPEILGTVPQDSLRTAAEIPAKIKAIRDFLRRKGRHGENPLFTVYVAPPTGDSGADSNRPTETPGSFTGVYLNGETWLKLDAIADPNPFPAGNAQRTVCLWVKRTSGDLAECGVFGYGTPEVNWESFSLRYLGDDTVGVEFGPILKPSRAVLANDGAWHHLAFAFSNHVYLYLDGVLVGDHPVGSVQTTFSSANGGSPGVYLGRFPGNTTASSNKFVGYVAELGIYNNVLDGGRIRAIYDARASELGLQSIDTTNLVAYYSFAGENLYNRLTNTNPFSVQEGVIEFVPTSLGA